jgi:hypothetical protein
MPRRSALIVPVAEAEPWVAELRLAHDPAAARGVPAHITVLVPFVPPELLDEEAVAQTLAPFDAFTFELVAVERFADGVVWLRPEPSRPFVELTGAFWSRWPEHPPYEGAHAEVIPHLTVSLTRIELELPLPIACRAREVTLLEEDEPDQRWRVRRRYQLGVE